MYTNFEKRIQSAIIARLNDINSCKLTKATFINVAAKTVVNGKITVDKTERATLEQKYISTIDIIGRINALTLEYFKLKYSRGVTETTLYKQYNRIAETVDILIKCLCLSAELADNKQCINPAKINNAELTSFIIDVILSVDKTTDKMTGTKYTGAKLVYDGSFISLISKCMSITYTQGVSKSLEKSNAVNDRNRLGKLIRDAEKAALKGKTEVLSRLYSIMSEYASSVEMADIKARIDKTIPRVEVTNNSKLDGIKIPSEIKSNIA